ncbi:MAG: DUF1800 family protein, partial [Candidatus Acidiferrales bacterium]
MHKKRIAHTNSRLDAPGAAILASTLVIALITAVPHASASNGAQSSSQSSMSSNAAPAPEHIALDKKFKGKLPITELTEDEAILHAMNRLAYGPRPGDVDEVRKIGLEKWVEQQLHPEAINDAELNQRLQRYPSLAMSSKRLLEEFPRPDQNAKQQGLTKEQAKEQYEQQQKAKQQQAESQIIVTGNDNLDKAQQQLAKLQGPNRIIAELSMAKVDRAVYSNRQLQAVMEDFWFNHFNVFANKGDDKWLLTSY